MDHPLENISVMEYPGRLIIIGLDESGKRNIVVYAVTGRSSSSRARRLEKEASGIWTRPTDTSALQKGDAELLIYPAVLVSQGIAVSNGKQTSDIAEQMGKHDKPARVLEAAIKNWDYEPDAPIFTSRISGCVLPGNKASLSIIRRGDDGKSIKKFYDLPMIPGKGKMISTYDGVNRDPVQSFPCDPIDVHLMENSAEKTAVAVFEALGPGPGKPDFRVAVACIFAGDLLENDFDVFIINNENEKTRGRHGKTG